MATGPPVQSEPELDPPVEFGTIMDPVHGSIQLDKYLFKIIDRPEFQRLRKIKQFAGVYYVYPGGVHTRFEHSIGVCYIAGKLVDALNEHPRPTKTDKRLWITKEEKICIQIAALCHDIGHGPFSHLYDFAVEEKLSDDEKKNELSSHEYRSAEIIKNMMNSNLIKELRKFKGSVEAFTSDEEYFKLVKRIITFDKDCKKLPKAISKRKEEIRKLVDVFGEEKSYLFEIVANGFTGIDVDKMDYFARDARSVGLPNSFDWRRFTQTARIIKCDEDGLHHICSRDKDALSLYELFHTRNALYRSVYRHKTVVIVEDLIKKALQKATIQVEVKGKDGGTEPYPFLKCWKKMDAFLLIDNSIEDFIMKEVHVITEPLQSSDESQTNESQQLQQLCIKRADSTDEMNPRKYFIDIRDRKLPKFLGRTNKAKHDDTDWKDWKDWKHEDIAICAAKEKSEVEKIKEKIIPLPVKFSYGKGSKDPIESHFFYGKFYPQYPFHIPKEEVSKILPSDFEEEEVFWYYDMKDDNDDETKAIARSLWECLNTHKLPTEFKSALEGSYARKGKLYKEERNYAGDDHLEHFQKIIESYRSKESQ